MLGCLGDSWFGKDVDRICSYNTPKIVKFRHRELGCMARTLKLLIGIYVFLFLIWYKGKHFKVYPITGMNRLTFQMPTRNMCNPKLKNCLTNFTRYSDLPYCSMTGEKSVSQLPCRAYDSIGLAVPYVEGVVLPTRIRAYSQKRAECSEEQESMGACKRLWEYLDDSGNEQSETKRQPLDEYFVANIEDYTMQIDHSFATPEIGKGYDDFKMQVIGILLGISIILAGQLDPSSMPAEKYEFTWKRFWPSVFRRLKQLYTHEGIKEFTSQLVNGEYSNYGNF